MKPILKQILVPAVSAVAGGLIVLGAIKVIPNLQSKPEKHLDSIFNEDIFHQGDPFEQMRKMREQMEKRMDQSNIDGEGSSNPFDSWFSNKFGGGVDDISKREDDDFIYYDIKVDDVKSTSIDTQVKNGYITITGTTEKKNESNDEKDKGGFSAQSIYKSTFKRTFPLPDHVDQNKMQMLSEKDKIVLKFPKLKAS